MLMYIGSFKQKYAIKDVLSESYYPRERTMQCIFTVDDKSGDTNVIKTSIFPEGATISSDNEGRNLAYAINESNVFGSSEIDMFQKIQNKLSEKLLSGTFKLERVNVTEDENHEYVIGNATVYPVTVKEVIVNENDDEINLSNKTKGV